MLSNQGFSAADVLAMHLYVKNMDHFGRINQIYKTYFGLNPPIRYMFHINVCLNLSAPETRALIHSTLFKISGFFMGGDRTKKNGGNLAPVAPIWPLIQSFNWEYWYLGPHFCLYGPDFGPKLALFTTKIRNFFHKI